MLLKNPQIFEEGGEGRSGYGVLAEGGSGMERISPRRRPVGQVVKTAASHAVNIGSNPVRVTTLFCEAKKSTEMPLTIEGENDTIE